MSDVLLLEKHMNWMTSKTQLAASRDLHKNAPQWTLFVCEANKKSEVE